MGGAVATAQGVRGSRIRRGSVIGPGFRLAGVRGHTHARRPHDAHAKRQESAPIHAKISDGLVWNSIPLNIALPPSRIPCQVKGTSGSWNGAPAGWKATNE